MEAEGDVMKSDPARLRALLALEGDINDLVQQCRVVDLLTQEAMVSDDVVKLSPASWELIEFATFQCTLRAVHLVARWNAAHQGEELPAYGSRPDGSTEQEGSA